MIADVEKLIDDSINEDIVYSSQPLDLRNQRTYAVKVGRLQVACKGWHTKVAMLVWGQRTSGCSEADV